MTERVCVNRRWHCIALALPRIRDTHGSADWLHWRFPLRSYANPTNHRMAHRTIIRSRITRTSEVVHTNTPRTCCREGSWIGTARTSFQRTRGTPHPPTTTSNIPAPLLDFCIACKIHEATYPFVLIWSAPRPDLVCSHLMHAAELPGRNQASCRYAASQPPIYRLDAAKIQPARTRFTNKRKTTHAEAVDSSIGAGKP